MNSDVLTAGVWQRAIRLYMCGGGLLCAAANNPMHAMTLMCVCVCVCVCVWVCACVHACVRARGGGQRRRTISTLKRTFSMPLSTNLEQACKAAAMPAAGDGELGAGSSPDSRSTLLKRVSSAIGQRFASRVTATSGKVTPWAEESSESSEDEESPQPLAAPRQLFSSRGSGAAIGAPPKGITVRFCRVTVGPSVNTSCH